MDTDNQTHNVTSLLMPGNIANTQSHTVSHQRSPILKTEDSNPAGSASSICSLLHTVAYLCSRGVILQQVSYQPLSFTTHHTPRSYVRSLLPCHHCASNPRLSRLNGFFVLPQLLPTFHMTFTVECFKGPCSLKFANSFPFPVGKVQILHEACETSMDLFPDTLPAIHTQSSGRTEPSSSQTEHPPLNLDQFLL